MLNFVAIRLRLFETANFEKSSVCSVGICIVQNGENRDYGENGMFSKKIVDLLAYIKKK